MNELRQRIADAAYGAWMTGGRSGMPPVPPTPEHWVEDVADAVLEAIAKDAVVIPFAWIAERRLEAWNMRKRVPGPYDQGFWDGCEAQLVEALLDCAGLEEQDVPGVGVPGGSSNLSGSLLYGQDDGLVDPLP